MKLNTKIGLIVALVGALLLSIPTVWRATLAPDTVRPNVRNVSRGMDEAAAKLLTLPHVVIGGVVIADVLNNTRTPVVSKFRDIKIKTQIAQYIVQFTDVQPVFTPNGTNTVGILNVINGGNVCAPFDTTIMYSDMPALGDTLKTACLFGAPFIDSRYRHYVLIFFDKPMTLKDMGPYMPAIEELKEQMYLSWVEK